MTTNTAPPGDPHSEYSSSIPEPAKQQKRDDDRTTQPKGCGNDEIGQVMLGNADARVAN